MCGIFAHEGDSAFSMERALSCIKHRGPDSSGTYENGSVSFGHQRLAIIDVSNRANQPFTSASGLTTIIFNGEIYNYRVLRDQLLNDGARLRTEGDTEVLVEGYERYGVEFFERLRGMWTFVIHDTRQPALLMGRDPFGIKPLYYSMSGDSVYIASELRCFRAAGLPLRPEPSAYPAFYNLGYFVGAATAYADTYKVLPGEVLAWHIKDRTLSTLKRLPRCPHITVPNVHSYEDGVSVLDGALTDSVKAHFVSDVPVSLLLSGGNDSSLIAALSKKIGFRPSAYHVAIEGSEDTHYARDVARELDIPLHIEELSQIALEREYERIWSVLDEPTGDVSVIPSALIYSRITGHAKVVLSGEGGDELFGGYSRHGSLMRHSALKRRSVVSSTLDTFLGTSAFSLSRINPLVQRTRAALISRGVPNDLIGAYLKQVRLIDYPIAEDVVRGALYGLLESESGWSALPFALDTVSYLPNDLLYKGDVSSMAASVEARVPFVDTIVASTTQQLFQHIDLRRATRSKRILKDVLARYLPRELVFRSKRGFGVPMHLYEAGKFHADFVAACDFHLRNRDEYGVPPEMATLITPVHSREIIAKKYPRFAFALISNWKLHEQK